MFSFLKNKNSAVSNNYQGAKGNSLSKISGTEVDSKILNIFKTNLSLFHKAIVSNYNIVKELNIGYLMFSDILKNSYRTGISSLKMYIDSTASISQESMIRTFGRQYGLETARIVLEPFFEETQIPFFTLIYAPKEEIDATIISLKKFMTGNTQSIALDFIKYQLKVFLAKVFTFEDFIKQVDKNIELTKILINAAYKYQEIEMISEETYELFLEYLNLSEGVLPFDLYFEFMHVYIASKNICRDYYSENELSLGFDYMSRDLIESIDIVIKDKYYIGYDVDKLVLSIIYNRLEKYDEVSLLFRDLDNFNLYANKLKNARRKDDLLNNDYSSTDRTIPNFDLMSGLEFEKFLCELLNKLGFNCETTKVSGDQGVDIIATKSNNRIAIQAKCYSQPVGNHAVMEVIAGAKYYNANQCMVITNSTFTKAAKELALVNGVILWDRVVLLEKMKEVSN